MCDFEVILEDLTIQVEPTLEDISITENGTYEPPELVDGFNKVEVNVEPKLESLLTTENGTFLPSESKDGFDSVSINVQPALQNKTVTENGTVTADDGYYGLGEVVVDVPEPVFEMFELSAFTLYSLSTQEKIDGRWLAPWIKHVTTMDSKFSGATRLRELNLEGWEMPDCTSLNRLCNNCTSLVKFFASGLSFSKSVCILSSLLSGCSSLQSVDFADWDTSAVTNMASLLSGCSSLQSVDFADWDTSAVTNMTYLLSGCSSLQSVDFADWDTSAVTNMSYLLYGCSSLQSVKLGRKSFLNVTANANFFSVNTRQFYVPDDMVDIFKSATNWSAYADRIHGWSEIPEGLFD